MLRFLVLARHDESRWVVCHPDGGVGCIDALPAGSARAEHIDPEVLRGDLHIDLQAYEVRKGAEVVSLTPSEFQLLVALANRPGEVIDYITLVRLALDYEAESWEAKELIKRHIFALRQKIEQDPSAPQLILNVRGVGYRLAPGPVSGG